MKTKTLASAIIAAAFAATPAIAEPEKTEAKVQIALLLDTSNSMDGLIDQTKTQLWKVVNTFIDAKRGDEVPFVEVALYEYGNNALALTDHYIRQVEGFTRDLDALSGHLFSLKTFGGQEYCGAVIRRAITDLAWDDDPNTYKAIFIAGNEPFTQGPIDPMQACRDAKAMGIIVNTIHCGPRQHGISGSWQDGAANGGGEFMVIDQDRAVRHIPAPQDAKIAELGIRMNQTYLGYGKAWTANAVRQRAADEDALAHAPSGAAVQRAVSKASQNYHNAAWDLVDATREGTVDLENLDSTELPEDLRELNAEALKARIDEAAKQRAAIQQEIAELNRARTAFIEAERQKQADAAGEKTLDEVMVETTRAQAAKLGYQFAQ